jgi:hypothetical protein
VFNLKYNLYFYLHPQLKPGVSFSNNFFGACILIALGVG